jgi:DNA-binding XRE family transcriptional regulator
LTYAEVRTNVSGMGKPVREPKKLTLNHEPEAVEYARVKAGLSKAEAASRAGMSPQLYGDIEAGRRNATPSRLRDLAAAFNCPVVVLERKRWVA